MKQRPIESMRWLGLVLLMLAMAGCQTSPRGPESAFAELEARARGFDGAAAHLAGDTDVAALAAQLERMEQEQLRVEQTLDELQERRRLDASQAEKLRGAHDVLRRLRLNKQAAILEHYRELVIEFVELNRWKLRADSQRELAEVDWRGVCAGGKRIIIYGYGDPIGGDQPTQLISSGRAESVAQWILEHSSCVRSNLLVRGLGVDVKSDEIANAKLAPQERENLFSMSRYARILIPK